MFIPEFIIILTSGTVKIRTKPAPKIVLNESTKAFGKAIRKQDLRQQLSMISDKDKATLGKLASLMRGAKKKKPNESLTKEDIAMMVREIYLGQDFETEL